MWPLTILSWGSKLLPLFRKPKVIGGLLLVAAVTANFWYIKSLQAENLELTERRALLASFYDQCQTANVRNQNAVSLLKRANESLATAITVHEDEKIRAIQEAADREALAALRLDDTIDEMERLRNANPTCEQLSQVDMGAACPAIVGRLRQHANPSSDIND